MILCAHNLRYSRLSAGLSLDDLALRLDTEPPISHRRRAEWLGDIEGGRSPISRSLLAALKVVAPEAFGWIDLADWPEDEVRATCAPCAVLRGAA